MNIALFGYGKMGKAIEKLALERQHTIVLKVNSQSKDISYKNIDIAIDFSTPEQAFNNIYGCLDNNIPVICGTTGWLDKYNEILNFCKEKKIAFIYASNFSLGVNLFFELNKKLATLMKVQSDYDILIKEIHHTEKLDKPSGTAITLANQIIDKTIKNSWVLEKANKANELPIIAERKAQVNGTHSVTYSSAVDDIEIKHTAKNREGFALGAIVAAEFLLGKHGVFTMKDVLNIT
jgi:4-hydroxy-tetrahydrodipicolinate reductase